MIRFACPGCSATFTVADEKAGKSGKCPKCQSAFVIPAAAAADESPADQRPLADPPASEWKDQPPPPAAPEGVEISPCPTCGTRLSVAAADVGSDVECPSCRTVFRAGRADAPLPPDTGSRRSGGGTLVRLGSGSNRDDDDDDRPSRRRKSSRRDDDDDDDDRPSRRRRSRRDDDDDDDDDDRPSRRSRRSRRSRYDEEDDYRDAGKPSQVQTIGVLLLIGGIIGLLNGLAFVGVAFGVCLTLPGGIYEVVYGIMAIIGGSQLMGNNPTRQPPNGLCVMAIICIINCDVLNLVFGIVGLSMLNNPEVQRYYNRR